MPGLIAWIIRFPSTKAEAPFPLSKVGLNSSHGQSSERVQASFLLREECTVSRI